MIQRCVVFGIFIALLTLSMSDAAFQPFEIQHMSHNASVRFAGNGSAGFTYTGPTYKPRLVDVIDLTAINPVGYLWGIAYDWDRNGLWICPRTSDYSYMYLINTTSPCVKKDSLHLGGGIPFLRWGIDYAGNDTLYMTGDDWSIYKVNVTTGNAAVYREAPFSAQGVGGDRVNDALYATDGWVIKAAWAKPSQSGTWNTFNTTPWPSGITAGYSDTVAPKLMFVCEQAPSVPGHFWQYSLVNGVPNTWPDSAWEYAEGMTHLVTADCTFDGKYVYILDQSAPPKVWIYDVYLDLHEHDAETFEIVAPAEYVMPCTTITPSVTYRNLGKNTETFDVYIDIDSAGSTVYSQSAVVTLGSLDDTTVVYAPWTVAEHDSITYNITAYAVAMLDGDPINDTLESTTITARSQWRRYHTWLPRQVYYHAGVYTDITGTPTVYSLGGTSDFIGTLNEIYTFDCVSDTWSLSPDTLNHRVTRHGAAVVKDKIYVIGGYPYSSMDTLYTQEYDPVAHTVVDKALMPTGRGNAGIVTWRDSLIYCIGGYTPGGIMVYDSVHIYDPSQDLWMTGTRLPIRNGGFACGISGDTIYVAGGTAYIAGWVNNVESTFVGIIDPGNPQNITWTNGPHIPVGTSGQPGRTMLQGACIDGKFYITSGINMDIWGNITPEHDTWFYDPQDNLWHQSFNKPTHMSYSQCAVYVPLLDNGTFLCAGGLDFDRWLPSNATEGLVNIHPLTRESMSAIPEHNDCWLSALSNPIRDRTVITYTTSVSQHVVLKIYDIAGRCVSSLVNSVKSPGLHTVQWSGHDNNGRDVASGVYFLRLTTETDNATYKLVKVR